MPAHTITPCATPCATPLETPSELARRYNATLCPIYAHNLQSDTHAPISVNRLPTGARGLASAISSSPERGATRSDIAAALAGLITLATPARANA